MTDRAGNVLTTISGDPNAPLPQDNSDNFGLPNSVNDPAISSAIPIATVTAKPAIADHEALPLRDASAYSARCKNLTIV